MAIVYYTATSLDGFIATPDDDVGFLDEVPPPTKDTYTPFIRGIGAIAMGRSTYEFLLRHMADGGDWPYPDHPVWVFTHHDFPERPGVALVAGGVADVLPDIEAAAGDGDIWVCGDGDLAGQFHDAGMLDQVIVTVASRTLGSGKPLLPRDMRLELLSARMLGPGFAELRYRPI